jgi:hypothetical protein
MLRTRIRPKTSLMLSASLAGFLTIVLFIERLPAADSPRPGANREALTAWRYVQELPLSRERTSKLYDFVIPVAVFDGARADLADLRLYDSTGKEIPFALRVRRSDFHDAEISTKEFNRAQAPGAVSELALDLGESSPEHNNVEVQLPGVNYRRHARLSGSDDGQKWRLLAEKNLIHFDANHQSVDDRHFRYPPSRFRFLRIAVERDPEVDEKAVDIDKVIVRRRVEIPGEWLDIPVRISPREPVRADGGPGSAWVFDLGGDHVPVERLLVDVADEEFVRNYQIEAGGPVSEADRPFQHIADGLWRRQAGMPRESLVAEFPETLAARQKLVVIDHRNPPLGLTSAKVRAAARQIVFADPGPGAGSLQLYFGNPKAEPPQYDFARNLPLTLDPIPTRLRPSERRPNPSYRPVPKALTERWPWLIYVILGAISAGLGVIIVMLARTAVRRHDALQPAERME